MNILLLLHAAARRRACRVFYYTHKPSQIGLAQCQDHGYMTVTCDAKLNLNENNLKTRLT